MVVVEILGVVKLAPVPRAEPPEALAYQLIVPAEVEADNTITPASQRLFGPPVTVGVAFMVAITAILAEVQLALEAAT